MEETKQVNELTVLEEEPKQTGIVAVNEYFQLMPDPAKVAQRADLTKGMLTALTRVVSPCNITDFSGKPYFDHLACERISKIMGLVIKLNETDDGRIDYEKVIEDQTNNKYTIYLTGRIYYTGREQDYEVQEGSSCSFDDWYSQYQNVEWTEDENGKKHKKVLNANALPESKVREKARANLIQRLVKKFLGLDFTWEELEAAGIDRSKCKGFTFSGNKGTDSTDTMDKKKTVWNKIVEICNGNIDLAKKSLQKLTSFEKKDGTMFDGYTDINKVSERMLPNLIKKVDEKYKEFEKEAQNADNE
jgi:hypothetical protein